MMSACCRTLKGCLSLFLYCLNLLSCGALILIIFIFSCLTPIKSWRFAIQKHLLQKMPAVFGYLNHCIMMISTYDRWDIVGKGDLQTDQSYIMLSNHQSWIDILVLNSVFSGRTPPLKFFMKKELLWQLPLAGLACYALGFPFMSRHSHAEIRKNPKLKGKDIETTKKACNRLRAFPSTLINFLEGTRFTDKKKERQQSPFKHLLKPHAGGVAVVIQELHETLAGIINVVIHYPKKVPNLWDFACGRFEKIVVRYEVLPITPAMIGDYYQDRNFRSDLQQWLNTVWQKNDLLIEKIQNRASDENDNNKNN